MTSGICASARTLPSRPAMLAMMILLFGVLSSASRAVAADVTTYHYDNNRTGWNAAETVLTPAALRAGRFAQLQSVALDNQVDAQPLLVSHLTMGDRQRDVLYVVTESNTVYAIDANLGVVLLQRQLGTPVETGKGKPIDCGNNAKEIGITSTPVIDRANDALYAIGFLWENNTPVYRLYALDLETLADKVPSQLIQKTLKLSDGEEVIFDARISRQRPALTLANGRLYAAFGSFCDHNADKARGWIMSFDLKTLSDPSQSELIDARPDAEAAYHLTSIWMSGAGPAVDDAGSIYFITGNSRPGKAAPGTPSDPLPYLAQSVVKTSGDLDKIQDVFTPSNFRILDLTDRDFGSGGLLLVPGSNDAGANLLVAAGKDGKMVLLGRDNLGKLSEESAGGALSTVDIGKCWCAQTYYEGPDKVGRILSSGGATLTSWKIATSAKPTFVKEWNGQSSLGSDVFQKGFFTSVSSDGTKPDTAVVWAVQRPTALPAVLTLWAFDAKSGAALTALPAGLWPNVGGSANAVPVVANGHVFVASFKELKIFGFGEVAAGAIAKTTPTPTAPSESELTIFGRVVSVNGTMLDLKTLDTEIKVDVSTAIAAHKAVTLTEGVAVEIFGSRAQGGTVSADTIEYAPDNPALWKTSAQN